MPLYSGLFIPSPERREMKLTSQRAVKLVSPFLFSRGDETRSYWKKWQYVSVISIQGDCHGGRTTVYGALDSPQLRLWQLDAKHLLCSSPSEKGFCVPSS